MNSETGGGGAMQISVVICTYNRSEMLKDTLISFLDGVRIDIGHELLVIDNNSTDHTREVVMSLAEKDPTIKYCFESKQGLSEARNSGINASIGHIIAFVDDDVCFDKYWLVQLFDIFDRNQNVSCVGGRVLAKFESERPDWLGDDLLWAYGVTRYGDEEKTITSPDIPVGCNMAFRRDVFAKVMPFQTSLGRKGNNLLSNEENAMFSRIEEAGLKVLYSPRLVVHHRIPSGRTKRQWIFDRFYWQGVSDIILWQMRRQRLSRGALITRAVKETIGLLKRLKGLEWSSRSMVGRYKSIPVRQRIALEYSKGLIKQAIVEAFIGSGGRGADSFL
jgi:glucosyl-dolichyl phosphate glucuronosyltransferase